MKITEIKTFPFRCGWRVWLFLKEHFLVPKDGFIELPKSPGLGLELDEEAVSRQPFKYRRGTTLSGLWGDMEAFGK